MLNKLPDPDVCGSCCYQSQCSEEKSAVEAIVNWLGKEISCPPPQLIFSRLNNDRSGCPDQQVVSMCNASTSGCFDKTVSPILVSDNKSVQPSLIAVESIKKRTSAALGNPVCKTPELQGRHCSKPAKEKDGRGCGMKKTASYSYYRARMPLIHFLQNELARPGNKNIKWKDQEKGVFQILKPTALAKAWGVARRRPHSDWHNLKCTMRSAEQRSELHEVTPLSHRLRRSSDGTYEGGTYSNTKYSIDGVDKVLIVREYQFSRSLMPRVLQVKCQSDQEEHQGNTGNSQ